VSRVSNGKVRTEATRGVTGITDGARWVATLSVEELGEEDGTFSDLDEVVTFAVTKANHSRKPDPVELARDERGLLRPLDPAEREIVAQKRAHAAPGAAAATRRERARTEREASEVAQRTTRAAEKEAERERREKRDAIKRAAKEAERARAKLTEHQNQDRALVEILAARATGILAKPLRAAMAARLGACGDTALADTIARLGDAVRVEPAPKNGRLHVLVREKLPPDLRGGGSST
jgi:hypothetical protein